jgi:hypothetical protein
MGVEYTNIPLLSKGLENGGEFAIWNVDCKV